MEKKHDERSTKPKGWFSRRHESRVPHETARATYLADHGPEARRENAKLDREERAKRGPEAQIEELDYRLGKGVGATRERERLNMQIATQAKGSEHKAEDRKVNAKFATKTTSKKES